MGDSFSLLFLPFFVEKYKELRKVKHNVFLMRAAQGGVISISAFFRSFNRRSSDSLLPTPAPRHQPKTVKRGD